MKFLVTALLFFCTVGNLNSEKLDYFWKEYLGEIPDDALPGGDDRTNKITYIGQVFIDKHGLLPATIHEGQTEVTTSRLGVHTSDLFVKILCSNEPQYLSWTPTTAISLHNDTVGKHLVVGGAENGKILNIGRIFYQGEVIVGKVCSYNVGNSLLYFPHRGQEVAVSSYEVLTYAKTY